MTLMSQVCHRRFNGFIKPLKRLAIMAAGITSLKRGVNESFHYPET
jgi:hypothetical protein